MIIEKAYDSIRLRVNTINQRLLVLYRKSCLKNKHITLISNDCTGGIILHDCGLRFDTPLINLCFEGYVDFIKYASHLREYTSSNIIQKYDTDKTYPVGVLKNEQYGDIIIHFVHYSSFEEAIAAWKRRCERIHYDNVFVIMHYARDGQINLEELSAFSKIPYNNKKILAYSVQIGNFNLDRFGDMVFTFSKLKELSPGKILEYSGLNGRRYLDEFDYVSFLNS